jgi:hypothetical protein
MDDIGRSWIPTRTVVEELPRAVASAPVGAEAARRKPHGELHDLLPVMEARVECHLAALDGAQFGADAVLLAPEHVTSMAFARAGLLIL